MVCYCKILRYLTCTLLRSRLNFVMCICIFAGTKTAVLFTRVPAGIHRLVLTARTSLEEVSVTYRLILPAEPNTCTAHLINRGITINNQTAVAEFSGFGPYNGFICKLDNPLSFPCECHLVLVSSIYCPLLAGT